MDLKNLLGKLDIIEGTMQGAIKHPTGPKFTGYWKGSDVGTPGTKMVGGSEEYDESILKDLSKGKSKEQELAEEFQAFLEAEFKDTVDKRPGRKNARPSRGHEPQPRYKKIKADEGAMNEKDIELQDYRSMSHKEFQTAYGMTKTEWINKNKSLVIQNPSIKKALGLDEAGSPSQQAAIAIAMKKAGKKPKNEQEELNQPRRPEVIDDLPKTPQDPNKGTVVKDYNRLPKDPNAPQKYPTVTDEGTAYKTANPHPASRDPIVAKVLKQMRPGLTGLDMGNEAFLYFAYELGKQRARDAWEDYLPAIRAEYEKGLAEGSYYGPVEARWMVKLSDDEGDHLKTYVDKFPSLSAAKKAYKNTPYATDFKYKPVKKDQVEEATDSDIVQAMGQDSINRAGYNPLRDKNDYDQRLNDLIELGKKPGMNKQMQDQIQQRILDLRTAAIAKGFIQSESRGHTIVANKLKDVERAKKFASGELKIPTPQERQAQLKKLEKAKPVKEYGANNPPQGSAVTPYGQPTTPKVDPAQAQQAAANLNVQKTAYSQLKQINPNINPQLAATAVTKDPKTMTPQEKEDLAQVAKTISPALGTPAFGSIKTAIQKSQMQAKK
jgi:hypothetical protein